MSVDRGKAEVAFFLDPSGQLLKVKRTSQLRTQTSEFDPKQTLRLFYLEMASGVQELLCSERIALSAHQKAKEFVHAACSGRARILYKMASHDCGKRFSRFAFDNRSRRRFPLAGGLKPYPGRDQVCLLFSTAAGVFEDFKYHREFLDGENAALEFSAHISNVELKAVHLMRFNAAGEFVEIEKLVRPAEGVQSPRQCDGRVDRAASESVTAAA